MLQNLQNEVGLAAILAVEPPSNGLPLGQKINFLKYGHIIHQSVGNFMQIKKNIRMLRSKPTEVKVTSIFVISPQGLKQAKLTFCLA